MNSKDKRYLEGTVGIRLEEKGELKTMDEINHVAARLAGAEKKTRLLIKHTGVYPDNEPVVSTGIAFHASLSQHCLCSSEEPVLFNEIRTNDGNGYDSLTGQFTAPLPGKYLFTVTVRAQFSYQVFVEIICNEDMLGRLTAGYDTTSSMTLAVELNKGDVVQVVHIGEVSGHFHGSGFTSFSGFLFD